MSIHELENRIKQLLENNNKLFIPYVMCGDGGFDKTLKLIRLLEVSGASIIEIGIPSPILLLMDQVFKQLDKGQ